MRPRSFGVNNSLRCTEAKVWASLGWLPLASSIGGTHTVTVRRFLVEDHILSYLQPCWCELAGPDNPTADPHIR
jgi:hypothetical protein